MRQLYFEKQRVSAATFRDSRIGFSIMCEIAL